MRKVPLALCVIYILSTGCGYRKQPQSNETGPVSVRRTGIRAGTRQPDLSSPQATVRSFVAALNKADLKQAAACVAGAKRYAALAEVERNLKRSKLTFSISDLHIATSGSSTTARMKVTVMMTVMMMSVERLQLRRQGANWKIVPADPGKLKLKSDKNKGSLLLMVSLLVHPEVLAMAHESARAASCRSNLTQISLSAKQFVYDHDDKFALKASSFKKSLMPYVKSEIVFRCPSDKSGAVSYSFNRNLEGVAEDKIKDLVRTVLLYEGKNGRLNFRHDGRANVAFADGHVQLVSRQQAKSLRWKP